MRRSSRPRDRRSCQRARPPPSSRPAAISHRASRATARRPPPHRTLERASTKYDAPVQPLSRPHLRTRAAYDPAPGQPPHRPLPALREEHHPLMCVGCRHQNCRRSSASYSYRYCRQSQTRQRVSESEPEFHLRRDSLCRLRERATEPQSVSIAPGPIKTDRCLFLQTDSPWSGGWRGG